MRKNILIILLFCLLVPAGAYSAAIPAFTPQTPLTGLQEPTRLALDVYGNIYVSDSLAKTVRVYDKAQNAWTITTGTTIGKPLGIAVANSKLYVGDDSDGSVRIFSITYNAGNSPTALALSGFLGPQGAGEFGMPNAIAVSAAGSVYVVDSAAHFTTDPYTGKVSMDYATHHVKIYNGSGVMVNSFGTYGNGGGQLEFPVDIAIDDTPSDDNLKTVYVADNVLGTIGYFYLNGTCKKETGSGCVKDDVTGECVDCKKIGGSQMDANMKFARLQGVSVDKLGRIYAVDAFQGEVRVFASEGDYLTKLGLFGSGICTLSADTCKGRGGTSGFCNKSYYKDEKNNDILVTDQTGCTDPKKANGTWYDGCAGLTKPACETNGGVWDENQYIINDRLDHPIDSAVLVNNGAANLYVTSSNSEKVRVFKVDNYSSLQISPTSLSFSATAGDADPAAQKITLSSVDTPITWTAEVAKDSDNKDVKWIVLDNSSGATTSTISVSTKINGLTAGSYSGTVSIHDNISNTIAEVPVSLTLSAPPVVVVPAALSVTPNALGFVGQVGGPQPDPKSLAISNTGGSTLNWTAAVQYPDAAPQSWLGIDKSAGAGSGAISVSVNITGLGAGEHDGSIIITAPSTLCAPGSFVACVCDGDKNADGSCMGTTIKTVGVTLLLTSVTGQITVNINIPNAAFTLSGPATYSGSSSGTAWTKSDALSGDYTITFSAVSGMHTPDPQSGSLAIGSSITFTANYVPLKVFDTILVGSGEDALVKVFDVTSDGAWSLNKGFAPFKSAQGVRVAAGDVDGDGVDEIISTLWDGASNRAWVVISKRDGGLVTSFLALPDEGRYGATVAAGDIDGDGLAEIVVGGGPGPMVPARVKIYKYKDGQILDTGVNLLAFEGGYGVNVALGDADGDGLPDLITSPGPNPSASGDVRIWKIDTKNGIGKWNAVLLNSFTGLTSKYGASVAAADLDGDGIAEIILGAGPGADNEARVEVYDVAGKPYGLAFIAGDWRYGVNVAAGDIFDDDGLSEIVVSPGHGAKNTGSIMIFDSQGNVAVDEIPVFDSGYGASVAIGGKRK